MSGTTLFWVPGWTLGGVGGGVVLWIKAGLGISSSVCNRVSMAWEGSTPALSNTVATATCGSLNTWNVVLATEFSIFLNSNEFKESG